MKHRVMNTAFMAFILGACTSLPAQSLTTNPSEHMNTETSTQQPYHNPQFTARESLLAVLQLLDDLKDINDLNLEQIKKSTRIELNEVDDSVYMPNVSFWQDLSASRYYNMRFFNTKNQESFKFAFSNAMEALPMTDVCELDLDQFHAALLKIGYRYDGASRDSLPYKIYKRGNVAAYINYRGESGEKVTHDCIVTIRISRGAI